MLKSTQNTRHLHILHLWIWTLLLACGVQVVSVLGLCQSAQAQGSFFNLDSFNNSRRTTPATTRQRGSREPRDHGTQGTRPESPLALNGISRIRPSTPVVRNSLPPCMTDSFVHEAGADAELIYGDESENSLPPYMEGFTPEHRIERGIHDIPDAGLTTGHGSLLPSAWGADEFILDGGEWSQSGTAATPQTQTPVFIPRSVSLDNFDFSVRVGDTQIDYSNNNPQPSLSFTSWRLRDSNR